MGARLRIILDAEEDRTLHELRLATTVSQRVKDRAEVIRLSHQGLYVEKIATYFNWNVRTVRETLNRWKKNGLGGLWDAPHPGAKRLWQPDDIEYLECCLREEQRTYNSQQLAQKLEKERKVKLSADHLRRVLKKKRVIWKRTRHSHRGKQDPLEKAKKLADLEMLEWSAAAGEIDLQYLDESGFCLWMPAEYSYYFQGEQKRLEQTKRQGQRISILGLIHPLVSFVYGLVVGSFDGERYIKMMDDQAEQAQKRFNETGRLRVIVQDNGPTHTCKKVQEKWRQWEEQGLFFFFLPKYCSEMNPIETEWHQLKTHELRGQMFEHELDLAYAVMDGVKARAEAGGYHAERFRFPSKLAS